MVSWTVKHLLLVVHPLFLVSVKDGTTRAAQVVINSSYGLSSSNKIWIMFHIMTTARGHTETKSWTPTRSWILDMELVPLLNDYVKDSRNKIRSWPPGAQEADWLLTFSHHQTCHQQGKKKCIQYFYRHHIEFFSNFSRWNLNLLTFVRSTSFMWTCLTSSRNLKLLSGVSNQDVAHFKI